MPTALCAPLIELKIKMVYGSAVNLLAVIFFGPNNDLCFNDLSIARKSDDLLTNFP